MDPNRPRVTGEALSQEVAPRRFVSSATADLAAWAVVASAEVAVSVEVEVAAAGAAAGGDGDRSKKN